MNRFPLVMDVIARVPVLGTVQLRKRLADERLRHLACTREVGADPPDVRGWTWPVADTPRPPKRGAPV